MVQKRLIGLDIMRTVAILLVLICHYSSPLYPFVSGWGERLFNLMNWIFGYFGVELFFVLSGFLIGRIFFDQIRKEQRHFVTSLKVFVQRRWWRTLPNYYLFIVINVLVIVLLGGNIEKYPVLKAVTFTQKIFPTENVRFFGVSWSLAVEEWFYLLLPLTFAMLMIWIKNKERSIKIALMFLLILPNILKIIYCLNHPILADHEEAFRYATLFRLDSIFSGVFFAYLWQSQHITELLHRNRNKLLIFGSSLLLFSFGYAYAFLVKPIQNSILYLIYTPLNSIAIVSFIPFLMSLNSNQFKVTTSKSINFVSVISYSLYLCHVPIKQLCDFYLRVYFNENSMLSSLMYIFLMLVSSLLVSNFIYNKFEIKLLQYRDKIVK